MKFRFALTVTALLTALAVSVAFIVPGTAATAASAPHPQAAASTRISTAHSSLGTYLVGPNGHTVYLWTADSRNESACKDACAKVWPPVMLKGKLVAGSGVKSSLLKSIPRTGGGRQVTYNGWPLYYYAPDTKAGLTKGEGSNSFGYPWYVLATSGKSIKSS